LGKLENGPAAGPINAVSHILWGYHAVATDDVDVQHTLTGAALNAAAVTSWAGVHELFMPRSGAPSVRRALLGGVATASLAYLTDYHVVPRRFTPGFEKRLSAVALLGMYATPALSLAAGSLARKR
jgi:hypothetical protein